MIYSHSLCETLHDYVIKWKHFPCYWSFVRGIHRSPVNSPRKVQWRGALMFSMICAWITVQWTIVRLVIWDAIVPIIIIVMNVALFHLGFSLSSLLLDYWIKDLRPATYSSDILNVESIHYETNTSEQNNHRPCSAKFQIISLHFFSFVMNVKTVDDYYIIEDAI